MMRPGPRTTPRQASWGAMASEREKLLLSDPVHLARRHPLAVSFIGRMLPQLGSERLLSLQCSRWLPGQLGRLRRLDEAAGFLRLLTCGRSPSRYIKAQGATATGRPAPLTVGEAVNGPSLRVTDPFCGNLTPM